VQTTFGGVCGAKKGGLALHFGLESAPYIIHTDYYFVFLLVAVFFYVTHHTSYHSFRLSLYLSQIKKHLIYTIIITI
ncbi:hypothetical protein AB7360_19575, partial [Providencia alcalifaciens]|uniref:hypothetical protein n=1 Tax=Providencia alcalifaciens TaxID=126385 RepID=UPI0032DBA7F6